MLAQMLVVSSDQSLIIYYISIVHLHESLLEPQIVLPPLVNDKVILLKKLC